MKKKEISTPKGEEIKLAKKIAKGIKSTFINGLRFSRLARKKQIKY